MELKHDSYRFVNWVLFTLAACINSIPTQAFSGVTPIASQVYQISQFEANATGLLFPISYIFLLIPANYIIDKKGLKLGTLLCEMCMVIGLLIRLLINVNFYLFYLGTFICSLGFCFMISGANKFANLWFPHHQIFLANCICVFGLFASDAIGTFFSSYFIRKNSTKEDIFDFFLWESVVLIIIHILMAIFFKGTPKNIQNYASGAKRNSFKQDLKALFHNKNYIVLFLCMTFIFGDLSLIFVFLPWITKTYGFQSQSNGYIIVSANIAGLVGCVVVGLLGKAISYRKKSLILNLATIVFLILIGVSLQVHSPVMAYITGGLTGFAAYPLLTTLTDFATQTTFPVGEATASGILLFGGQLSGVILAVVFSFIFDGQSLVLTRVLNALLVVVAIFGFIALYFSKQILKREEYQIQKEKIGLLDEQQLQYKENYIQS